MIFLVWFGETNDDISKTITDYRNSRLSSTGEVLAQTYRESLNGIQFDKVYQTPAWASQHTLRIIRPPGVAAFVEALDEPNRGLYEGQTYASLKKLLPPKEYRLWDRDYFCSPPEGESMADLSERVLNWYRQADFSGNVLIVVGPSVMKVLLGYLKNLDEAEIVSLEPYLIPYGFDNGR